MAKIKFRIDRITSGKESRSFFVFDMKDIVKSYSGMDVEEFVKMSRGNAEVYAGEFSFDKGAELIELDSFGQKSLLSTIKKVPCHELRCGYCEKSYYRADGDNILVNPWSYPDGTNGETVLCPKKHEIFDEYIYVA